MTPTIDSQETVTDLYGSVTVAEEKRRKLREEIRLGRKFDDGRINWVTAIAMTAFHVLAIGAFFFFSWKNVAAAVVMYFLAINVGIGMCYHRLLTHRGYRTSKFWEYVLTICGTLALEGGPIFWVATHRVHHQNSDQEGDPHSPHDGTWWAHAGWILTGRALHSETALLGRYAPDLTRDRVHVWLSKYHWLPLTIAGFLQIGIGAALAPAGHRLAGGLGMMFWATFLRVCLGLHATWLTNSAAHLWGKRRFETRDDSRNSWWVAIFTGGEGWHNNHHAHPVSARHGLVWYEFDINYYGIWLMEKLGLAKKVQIAKWDPENPKPAGV
ncbi:acyl-CoA desaturase [Granulicella cerasi]|uniref:Acyl-CoA desaturase n=1 Tax=Granulicella cerasi TaxID=741063 RepID=A0ABW1ZD11_9BACT|nr:fatty acid desaturase [Granulicella cerasi]